MNGINTTKAIYYNFQKNSYYEILNKKKKGEICVPE